MDFDILKQLMDNELLGMESNHYKSGLNGTVRLAEYHIENISRCSSKRLDSSSVELFYNNKSFGVINGQTPSTSDKKAIRLCNNKMETEKILIDNDIKTTESILLGESDYELAESIIKKADLPMVLKPYNLNAGRGITLNVDTANFNFAWTQAKKAYENTKKKFKILIQPMLPGIETRMLIVEGQFNSAILRIPANIVGDGKHTIKELIDLKNQLRSSNPHLKRLPLKITEMVEYNIGRNGMTLNTIPEDREIIFLHYSSNISLGGDSYEISHLIGNGLKKVAEHAVSAIPGINTAGVDVLFESFEEEPAVLEINPGANLRMHHYPWKGEPKTPVFDLIDSMLKSFKS